jgi:hypothetical protein
LYCFWNPYFFIYALFLNSLVVPKISKPKTLKTYNDDTKIPEYLENPTS